MKSPLKREEPNRRRNNDHGRKPQTRITDDDDDYESTHHEQNGAGERRRLRSDYGAILSLIKVKTDEIWKPNSNKFNDIMEQVDQLHHLVKNPREQVADAEAFSGLAGSFETSLRSHHAGDITPTAFISRLLEKFGQIGGTTTHENAKKHILWKELGLQVSPVFRSGKGCCTMLHSVKIEFKQRKVPIYRKQRKRRSIKAEPKQYNSSIEEKTDTDINMAVMFKILSEKRRVNLENLILNRISFAQTVENLFALSFLVKDGRVLIAVDENGSHLVSPRNAPHSRAIMSGEVVFTHFIFRFDFCDWKIMKACVAEGEELMPVRNGVKLEGAYPEELVSMKSQSELTSSIISQSELPQNSLRAAGTIPMKMYSRKVRVRGKQMGKECPEVAS